MTDTTSPPEPPHDPGTGQGSRTDISEAMTDKQRLFAQAYVGPAKFNARLAAELAGISVDYGKQLMAKAHVVAYIATIQREAWERGLSALAVTRERVEEELASIAFADITDFLEPMVVRIGGGGGTAGVSEREEVRWTVRNPKELPPHVRRALKKIKARVTPAGDVVFEVELHDKMDALKVLALWTGGINPNDGQSLRGALTFTGLTIIPAKPKEKAE